MTEAPPYCDDCGRPVTENRHERCRDRRQRTDPPRFCTICGRKLAVQVHPLGFTARCVKCGPVGGATPLAELQNRSG
jgi:predicted amidophosphoribosyltransferase